MSYTVDRIQEDLAGLFAVQEWHADATGVSFYGRFLRDSRTVFELARERLEPWGLVPLLRRGRGVMLLRVAAFREPPQRKWPWVQCLLFLATVVSTTIAGTLLQGENPFVGLNLVKGIPFSFTMLAILGMHELAHYITGRHHGAAVAAPYFIPAPTLFGTMGAVISMRSPYRDRRSLIDIGISGPITSFVLATVATGVGFHLSSVVQVAETASRWGFGSSIMTMWLVRLVLGEIPEGSTVMMHPVALAGWFGLLITGINLLPVGQLDGGHISYALLGKRYLLAGKIAAAAVAGLGLAVGFGGWIFFGVVVSLVVEFRHPLPLDDVTEPERWRKAMGCVAIVILILSFVPLPIGAVMPAP